MNQVNHRPLHALGAFGAFRALSLVFLFTLQASFAADLNTARQLIALGNYSAARGELDAILLTPTSPDASAARELRLLLAESDTLPNAAKTTANPTRVPTGEWIDQPAPYLLSLALNRGVGALLNEEVQRGQIIVPGFGQLLDAATSAPKAAMTIKLCQQLRQHLVQRPWITCPERHDLTRELVAALRKEKRSDQAVSLLLQDTLPAETLVCLEREPERRLIQANANRPGVQPLATLLDLTRDVDHRRVMLAKLKDCPHPEGVFLYQLLLLQQGETAQFDAFINQLNQHGIQAFRRLIPVGQEAQLYALVAQQAENARQYEAAHQTLSTAFQLLPAGASLEDIQPLLGGLTRVAPELGAAIADEAARSIVERFACSHPNRDIRFYAWERAAELASEANVLYATLRQHCPTHARLRAFDIDVSCSTGDRARAESEWFLLLATHPADAFLAVSCLTDLLPANPDLITDPRFARGLRAALDAAQPRETAALAERIPRLAGDSVEATLNWMDLLLQTLRNQPPEAAASQQGFMLAAAEWIAAEAVALEEPSARRSWWPRLLFPADVLKRLELDPIPMVAPDPILGLNSRKPTDLPYLEATFQEYENAGRLDRLVAALAETELEEFLYVRNGGAPEARATSLGMGWMTARHLLSRNRINELLKYLEANPTLRDTASLLAFAKLLAATHVAEARYLLNLQLPPSTSAEVAAPHLKAVSEALAQLGFQQDALTQARNLLRFPAESHRRLGRRLVLEFERDWLAETDPTTLAGIIRDRKARLENDPTNVDLLEECHRLYAYQKQTLAAVNMLRRRANATPDNPSPRLRLGVYLAEEAEEPEEAWLAFQTAHDVDPYVWLVSGKLQLIQKVALNRSEFMQRVNAINLASDRQNKSNIRQLFNVLAADMSLRPIQHPHELLSLTDRLLAANPAVIHPIKDHLLRYRATLLLATDRRLAARPILENLFQRANPPTDDLYFGKNGLTGLAVDYQCEFGEEALVKSDFWQVALQAQKHEYEGKNPQALARYVSLLDDFNEASSGQARHLLNHLTRIAGPTERGEALLPMVKFAMTKKPKVLREIALHLAKTPAAPSMLKNLQLLPYASDITPKEKAAIQNVVKEIEAIVRP